MKTLVVSTLLVILAGSSLAYGQWVNNKAATAGESYARGLSDMIWSRGEANLRNSEAAINYEQARSMNMENRLQYTNTYFENRRMNRAYRAAERGPRPTAEQLYRLAQERAPKRLDPSQLDPVYGKVNWPPVLMGDEYSEYRSSLNELFASRATGKIDGRTNFEIQQNVRSMTDSLKSNISNYTSTDYMQARNFLTSLMAEPQFASR
jgi:hypothetical protein